MPMAVKTLGGQSEEEGARQSANALLKVSQPIRDAFWVLSSGDYELQTETALKLPKLIKSEEERTYCTNRLLKGLASAKASTRTAFVSALSQFLKHVTVTADSFSDSIDKALPMKDPDVRTDQAIGQALACLALLRSRDPANFETDIVPLVERVDLLRKTKDKRHLVELFCFQFIVSCAETLDGKVFKKKVYPSVSDDLNGLDFSELSSNLNLGYLALEIYNLHPKRLSEEKREGLETFSKTGKSDDCWKLLADVNRSWVNSPGFHPVVKSFVQSIFKSRDADDAAIATDAVISKFLKGSSLDKAFGLHILSCAIGFCTTPSQVDLLLTSSTLAAFVSVCVANSQPKQSVRALNDVISAFFQTQRSKTLENSVKVRVMASLIRTHPHFDRIARRPLIRSLVWANPKLRTPLIREVIAEFPKIAEKPTSVAKVISFFQVLGLFRAKVGREDHELLLRFFAALSFLSGDVELAENYHVQIPSWISETSMKSDVKYQESGKRVREAAKGDLCEMCNEFCHLKEIFNGSGPGLSPVNFEALRQFLKWLKKQKAHEKLLENQRTSWLEGYGWISDLSFENATSLEKGLGILAIFLLLGTLRLPDHLGSHLTEILAIRKDFSKNLESSLPIFVDLMLGLLSLPHRFLRVPFQMAFFYFCDNHVTLDILKPLLNAIDAATPESELMRSSDEVDEDFEPISSEELSKIEAEEDSDGDESENEENPADLENEENQETDDVENGEINPQFKDRLKKALGYGEDSDSEDLPDLDDEAMFRLDDTLAEIFRDNIAKKGGSKEKKKTAEEIRSFRCRVCDLLKVFLHSNSPLGLRVGLHPTLVLFAQKANKKQGENLLCRKIMEVAKSSIAMKLPAEKFADFDVLGFVEKVLETAKEVTDHVLQCVLADGLLLMLGVVTAREESEQAKMVDKIVGCFENFLTDRQCHIGLTLFSVVFAKNPELFFKKVPHLTRFWEENHEIVSPPRKTDLTNAIREMFVNQKLATFVCKEEFGKSWIKFAKRLRKVFLSQIALLETEKEQTAESSEFKPRYFGSLFNLVITLGKVKGNPELMRILFDDEMVSKLQKMESKDFWKLPPQSRSCGYISSQNHKRHPEKLAGGVLERLNGGASKKENTTKGAKKRKRENSTTESSVEKKVKNEKDQVSE